MLFRSLLGLSCIGWVAVGILSAGYIALMTALTHHPPPEQVSMTFVKGILETHPILMLIAGAIVAPVTEEIMFRGLLFGALQKWCSPVWTIALSSSVFAAMHWDLFYFVPVALIGSLLGWLRHKTGSIWFSALFHGIYNAFAMLAYLALHH